MFDIGFSELLLILIIGLVVLGPKRLPIAIRTVMGWVRTIRGLASNVQNELAQELKLQELQESIKKAEALNLSQLSPELEKTVAELKHSAAQMQKGLDSAKTTWQEANDSPSTAEPVEQAEQNLQNVAENRPLVEAESVEITSELSPAEIAELAEQDEERLMVYYPPDDDLATPTDTTQDKQNVS